jgi:D-alanyl-D-alanine carboxypeptidase
MRRACTVFLASALAAVALPQARPDVDAFVEKEMARQKTPGVSIAIVQDGKIVYSKGYGLADVENKVPAAPETVYQIGSVTKQFTSMIVMMLEAEGKLKISEPVRSYMPELPESWKDVTLRHLLTHTSGIKSYTAVPEFGKKMRDPIDGKGFLEWIGPMPLDTKPGEKWEYNNSAYFVLGLLIEKLEGKPYREVLKKRILEPLGMTHTDMNDPSDIVPHRAHGYSPVLTLTNALYIDMSWPYAAGSMISTVEDLAKWDAALYGEKLVKRAAFDQMWTPVKLNSGSDYPYGFGWALGSVNGTKVVEHGGGIPGFTSMITRFPEKKLTVIVLSNALPFAGSGMSHGIAAIVDPTLKMKVEKITDTDAKTTAFHLSVVHDLIDGKLKPELFTEEMRKVLFPGEAEQAHRGLGPLGKPTVFELISENTENGLRTRVYHVVLGPLEAKATFVTNKEGKISGMQFSPA